MSMANIDHWAGSWAGAWGGSVRFWPATTMVEVKRLIDPDMLVEIEADAIIG